MRWTGSGEVKYEKSKSFYSGDRHEREIGDMLSGEAIASFRDYRAVSDTVILVKLLGTPLDSNVIQVYAPQRMLMMKQPKSFMMLSITC